MILSAIQQGSLPDIIPVSVEYLEKSLDGQDYQGHHRILESRITSPRSRRLFAVSSAWYCLGNFEQDHGHNKRPRKSIIEAEVYADLASPTLQQTESLAKAHRAASEVAYEFDSDSAEAAAFVAEAVSHPNALHALLNAVDGASRSYGQPGSDLHSKTRFDQSRYLTLFIPIPEWNRRFVSDTTIGLAQAIYEEKSWDRLPILADSLEELDFPSDHWLLSLLRDSGFQRDACRGMWFMDQLIGRIH